MEITFVNPGVDYMIQSIMHALHNTVSMRVLS